MWIKNIIMNVCAAIFTFLLILVYVLICSTMTETNALIFSGILFVVLLAIATWIACL